MNRGQILRPQASCSKPISLPNLGVSGRSVWNSVLKEALWSWDTWWSVWSVVGVPSVLEPHKLVRV